MGKLLYLLELVGQGDPSRAQADGATALLGCSIFLVNIPLSADCFRVDLGSTSTLLGTERRTGTQTSYGIALRRDFPGTSRPLCFD